MTFNNSESSNLTFSDIVEKIKNFIESDENGKYKLTIGTDSEEKNDKNTERQLVFIIAVVIHRIGFGGRYFWGKKSTKKVKTLREKIYSEVLFSIETAKYLIPELKSKLNGANSRYDLEIHIDVGEKGETRDMIREVVGIVTGNGFVAKTKPDSYAATNVADKHV